MTKLSLPIARIVRENVSILMAHAFSLGPLGELFNKTFQGEWKQYQDTLFSLSEQRAEKACIELAIFLRYLDDEEGLSKYFNKIESNIIFGSLSFSNRKEKELELREVANKIIHSRGYKWDVSQSMKPKLICISRESEKWSEARIDIVALSTVCGSLMG